MFNKNRVMLKNKVYIIEYEMISPIALGKDEFIKSIISNKSAEEIVERVNTDGFPFKKAAEVKKDLTFLYEKEKENAEIYLISLQGYISEARYPLFRGGWSFTQDASD